MTVLININGDIRDSASLDLPKGREFRSAWTFNGAAVEVDMTKAKDIQRDTLRQERKPKLEELDVEVMKALESGKSTSSVAAEKQRLRDLTKDPRIEAAQTPEELKALTLEVLLK
jgi:hypothetical protein